MQSHIHKQSEWGDQPTRSSCLYFGFLKEEITDQKSQTKT